MATVNEGKVVLFGAGGPVGASAIAALKGHYALRVTDLRPMTEVAAAPPQNPRAPIPEVLGPPHENRVVDITDYALSKYLGGHITRVFAEREGLEVLSFVYTHFRPREVLPEEQGQGVHPYTTSWEDTGEAFLYGLRASEMPSLYENFFICARLPHDKYRPDKAKRLLGWEAKDCFEALYARS